MPHHERALITEFSIVTLSAHTSRLPVSSIPSSTVPDLVIVVTALPPLPVGAGETIFVNVVPAGTPVSVQPGQFLRPTAKTPDDEPQDEEAGRLAGRDAVESPLVRPMVAPAAMPHTSRSATARVQGGGHPRLPTRRPGVPFRLFSDVQPSHTMASVPARLTAPSHRPTHRASGRSPGPDLAELAR